MHAVHSSLSRLSLHRLMLWLVTVMVLGLSGGAFAQHLKAPKASRCDDCAPKTVVHSVVLEQRFVPAAPELLAVLPVSTQALTPSAVWVVLWALPQAQAFGFAPGQTQLSRAPPSTTV